MHRYNAQNQWKNSRSVSNNLFDTVMLKKLQVRVRISPALREEQSRSQSSTHPAPCPLHTPPRCATLPSAQHAAELEKKMNEEEMKRTFGNVVSYGQCVQVRTRGVPAHTLAAPVGYLTLLIRGGRVVPAAPLQEQQVHQRHASHPRLSGKERDARHPGRRRQRGLCPLSLSLWPARPESPLAWPTLSGMAHSLARPGGRHTPLACSPSPTPSSSVTLAPP